MEELHARIGASLRDHRRATSGSLADAERDTVIYGIRRGRFPAPLCQVCGMPVDDGGMFSLADMQLRRQCAEHYCPF